MSVLEHAAKSAGVDALHGPSMIAGQGQGVTLNYLRIRHEMVVPDASGDLAGSRLRP